MKTITIELSRRSSNSAIKKLERYPSDVVKKLDLVCEKLATIAQAEAQERFANHEQFGNDRDFTLTPIPVENGFKIVAQGHDIGFIEFGAGWAAGAGHPYASNAPFPVADGSYSKINTGEYAKYGSWHYKKVKMTHLLPEMPMFYAMQEMRKKMPEIVREVFK